MKANQKFVQADEAVSPVIGVILMVAITVVLAAVVFVLVSDLGGSNDATPSISATVDHANDDVTITRVTNGPVNWGDLELTGTATCAAIPSASTVTAGYTIDCSTAGTVILRHIPTEGIALQVTIN